MHVHRRPSYDPDESAVTASTAIAAVGSDSSLSSSAGKKNTRTTMKETLRERAAARDTDKKRLSATPETEIAASQVQSVLAAAAEAEKPSAEDARMAKLLGRAGVSPHDEPRNVPTPMHAEESQTITLPASSKHTEPANATAAAATKPSGGSRNEEDRMSKMLGRGMCH